MYVSCLWPCHPLPVWLWIRWLPRFNVLIHKMKVLPRQIQSKLHFRGYKRGTRLITTIPWWSALKTALGNKAVYTILSISVLQNFCWYFLSTLLSLTSYCKLQLWDHKSPQNTEPEKFLSDITGVYLSTSKGITNLVFFSLLENILFWNCLDY